MKKYILFIFGLFIHSLCFSQCEEWKAKIKIITFKGDTISNAYVKKMNHFYSTNHVFRYRLKNEEKCFKKNINAREIKEIKYGGNRYLHKEMRNGTTNFLSIFYDKEIKYYTGTYQEDVSTYLNGPRKKKFKITTYHYLEIDGKIIYVKEKDKKFKKQMEKLFGDAPKVQELLLDENYCLYDLVDTIDCYLKWKNKEENININEK